MEFDEYVYEGFIALIRIVMLPIFIPLWVLGWIYNKIENYLIERKLNRFK